jgi:RNA polymerase sigma-54 factor
VDRVADVSDWRTDLVVNASLEVAAVDLASVDLVVANLDERGLLVDDVDDLAHRYGTSAASIAAAIAAIRLVGPPGVAASSPLDCVKFQVRRLVETGEAPAFLVTIVDEHLDLVADDRIDDIAMNVGCAPSKVREAIDVLRRRTRPWVDGVGRAAAPIDPDLIIRYRGDSDDLIVETTDAAWFGLRVEDVPVGGETWAAPYVRDAHELVRQIDIRASALRRVGHVLVVAQREFLTHGPSSHRALRRQDVAEAIGVHPSTVGRAVNAKWLRCPDGRVVPLSECFGAATGPMQALRQVLADHPGASDAELTQHLAEVGIQLARRTVAKYRNALCEPARRRSPVRR